jgi:hypothetical protein
MSEVEVDFPCPYLLSCAVTRDHKFSIRKRNSLQWRLDSRRTEEDNGGGTHSQPAANNGLFTVFPGGDNYALP